MTVSMRGPAGCSGISVGGVNYEADADGFVDVPFDAVEAAKHHRFVVEARPDSDIEDIFSINTNKAKKEKTRG